jgi:phosphatidylglycerol:prolipoprotein diacylglycerol transferase
MIPYSHILGLQVATFGLMLWLAAVSGAIVMDRAFKRAHIDADGIGMVAISVLSGMVGAKLWHVLDTPQEFSHLGWSVL